MGALAGHLRRYLLRSSVAHWSALLAVLVGAWQLAHQCATSFGRRPARTSATHPVLITFEGPDGSGKTTQVEYLRFWLADRDPLFLREPGGTLLGERVRALLLHAQDLQLSPEAELELFLAARAQLVAEVIRPALDAGRIVVLDRYHDSSRAYQGGARGLEVGWPAWLPVPDLTFLLAVPAQVGLARRAEAGGGNRMEAEELGFHEKVAAAYDRLAGEEPERWVRLDATLPPEQVQEQVRARVGALLEGSTSS